MRSGYGKWSSVIFGGKRTRTSLLLSAEPLYFSYRNWRKDVNSTEHARPACFFSPGRRKWSFRNWRPWGKWSLRIRSPGVMTRIRGSTWGRRRVLERVSFRVCSAEFWASLLCGVCPGFLGPQMEGPGLRSGLARAGLKRCLGARVRRAEALLWNRAGGDQNRPGWSGSSYPLRLRVGGDGGRGGTGAWWGRGVCGRRRGPVSPWSFARTLGSQGFPDGLLIGSSDIGKFEAK